MDRKQHQHLSELRQIYQKRLDILQKQAAGFGLYTPPYILAEIEDVTQKIADIDLQFSSLYSIEQQLSKQELMTILFLSSDPTDTSRLRLNEEFREIQEKLKLATLRDRFKLVLPQLSARAVDISQSLLDFQPQIVHFSGHGTSLGALCFEDQTGESQLVQAEALGALFEQFSYHVKCVLLNACYSEIQAEVIARHIDFVIGMNQAIGDKAAIAFAIGFYQALGAGRTIREAYKLGCVQIQLHDIPGHLIPVLIDKGQKHS